MQHRTSRLSSVVCVCFRVAASVVLAGCGGGGGEDARTKISGGLLSAVTDTSGRQEEPALALVSLPLSRFEAPPEVDGKLDDSCWDAAANTGPLAAVGEGPAGAGTTTCALGFDGSALYVAFRCDLPPATQPKAEARERDSEVWEDDSLELLIDPSRNRTEHYRYAANARAAQYDSRLRRRNGAADEDSTWDAEWEVATQVGDAGWTAEVAVPFEALRVPDLIEGSTWGLCLVHRAAGGAAVCWTSDPSRLDDPAAFAEVVLGEGVYTTEVASPGRLVWGRNSGELTLTSRGGHSGPLDVTSEISGGEAAGRGETVTVIVPKGKSRTVQFDYDVVARSGDHELSLTVRGRGSGEVYHFSRYPLKLGDLLSLSLDSQEYGQSAEEAVAQVEVRAGGESLAGLRVDLGIAAADAPEKELSAGSIKAPPGAAEVILDLSKLPAGAFTLTGELVDKDGTTLGAASQSFTRLGGETGNSEGATASDSAEDQES